MPIWVTKKQPQLTDDEKSILSKLKLLQEEISNEYQFKTPIFTTQDGMKIWREKIDKAAPLAHKLYLKLSKRGYQVEYNHCLLKNRKRSNGSTPDNLEFHQDDCAIEDLVNFCSVGFSIWGWVRMMRKEDMQNQKIIYARTRDGII